MNEKVSMRSNPGLDLIIFFSSSSTGGLNAERFSKVYEECKSISEKANAYVRTVMGKWGVKVPPPLFQEKEWFPKNKEIVLPPMKKEIALSNQQWNDINFPTFEVPTQISTHVNVDEWEKEALKVAEERPSSVAQRNMNQVLEQLRHGVDSEVQSPGDSPTVSRNFFPEPHIDIPRICDSLATEIKSQHMAGPLSRDMVPGAKINSLISVKKPDGSRRQVGNLSSPEGKSFNEGISEESLAKWRVYQTTSKMVADMIARSGANSLLACCDIQSAYKCLPVTIKQRRLQCFEFLGKLFMDLRMIFGDQSACMHFDRFHYCIIEYFVLPRSPIPRLWCGRTVDDVPVVVPRNAAGLLRRFTETYKEQLTRLDIKYAPVDEERIKAFDMATSGEVLGVWFSTPDLTWKLSDRKLVVFINELMVVLQPDAILSLNQVEIIHGKLAHFSQLAKPIKLFLGEVLQLLRKMLEDGASGKSVRFKKAFVVPVEVLRDIRTCLAIVWDTMTSPLPIMEEISFCEIGGLMLYSDYSGHLLANPSLGIYCPAMFDEEPLVCSLAYQRDFLLKIDDKGHKAYSKSTSLEALGFLVPLLIDPLRFLGRNLTIVTDNAASAIILKKGYSNGDMWATVICRAARVVAAGLCCKLQANWEPRRSSRPTRIADDLTHNLLLELNEKEVDAYIERAEVSFPQPILAWMKSPHEDLSLGNKCLKWLESKYPVLCQLH